MHAREGKAASVWDYGGDDRTRMLVDGQAQYPGRVNLRRMKAGVKRDRSYMDNAYDSNCVAVGEVPRRQ